MDGKNCLERLFNHYTRYRRILVIELMNALLPDLYILFAHIQIANYGFISPQIRCIYNFFNSLYAAESGRASVAGALYLFTIININAATRDGSSLKHVQILEKNNLTGIGREVKDKTNSGFETSRKFEPTSSPWYLCDIPPLCLMCSCRDNKDRHVRL